MDVRGADVARVGADVARVDVAGDVLGGVGGAVVVEVRDAALARAGDRVVVVLRHDGGNCEGVVVSRYGRSEEQELQ